PNIEKLKARGDHKGLIRALTYKDPDVRQSASDALVTLGNSSIAFLRQALETNEAPLRRAAAKPLAEIGLLSDEATRQAVIEPLCQHLRDPDNQAALAAASALALLHNPSAVGPLCAALKNQNAELRRAAAHALGEIADSWAMPALNAATNDPEEGVRHAAMEALDHIGVPKDTTGRIWYAISHDDWEMVARFGTQAAEPLMMALNDPNPNTRCHAAEALGQIVVDLHSIGLASRTIRALATATRHPDMSTRLSSIESLGSIAHQGNTTTLRELAAGPLEAALEDPDPDIRKAAIRMLPTARIQHATNVLILRLGDMDPGVRLAAVNSLTLLGDEQAAEALIGALNDQDAAVRRAAVSSLGKIGDRHAVERLILALRGWQSSERLVVHQALVEIGPLAIDPLLGVLKDPDDEVRRTAAITLEKLGWLPISEQEAIEYWSARHRWVELIELGAAAVPVLLDFLDHPDPSVKQSAADALASLEDPSAVTLLINTLQDPRPLARLSAARGLENLHAVGSLDEEARQTILLHREKIKKAQDPENNLGT
ncbi:MAG TPA: HEAT repeat domain-containing protein, partial [Anaerolineaceae bacterium]|nr:HEAT repeat domain-containing protein [Anaerolineaceae bacterium]